MPQKRAYICGPLTELGARQEAAKRFYERLADACYEILGVRAFVPHEHYDPVKHAHYTPSQVDEAERKQVREETSLLVVVALAPSWGGGVEVEMANTFGVPAILLCEQERLDRREVSRLLQGNPAFVDRIAYHDEEDALEKFSSSLQHVLTAKAWWSRFAQR